MKTNDQVTVLVVLFAKNRPMNDQLKRVLHSLSEGYKASRVKPFVKCLFREPAESEAIEYEFAMVNSIFTKIEKSRFSGTPFDQIRNFFTAAGAAHREGPVRVIIGGHGIAPFGFDFLIYVLKRIAQDTANIILRKGNRLARQRKGIWRFRSYFKRLRLELREPLNSPTSVFKTEVDFTLDELHKALESLNKKTGRTTDTLILHACVLSTLESCIELHAVATHHIACETLLFGYLQFDKWFEELSDPTISALEITNACFDVDRQSAKGVFSSHRLPKEKKDHLIAALNLFGASLLEQVKNYSSNKTESEIVTMIDAARNSSRVFQSKDCVTIDVVQFAMKINTELSTKLRNEQGKTLDVTWIAPLLLRDAIEQCQLRCARLDPDNKTSRIQAGLRGIGIFLPPRDSELKLDVLPGQFHSDATQWVAFLKFWLSIDPEQT